METVVRIVVGLLVLAHGLVHLLWFAPADDEKWPFRLDRSWLVPDSARRPVAIALIALTVTFLTALSLAVWGVPGLATAWPALALAGAIPSLVALLLFFDRQLLWGMAIDVVIIVIAVLRPSWTAPSG